MSVTITHTLHFNVVHCLNYCIASLYKKHDILPTIILDSIQYTKCYKNIYLYFKLHIHSNITQHNILVHYIFIATVFVRIFVKTIYYSCTFEIKHIEFLRWTSGLLTRCLKKERIYRKEFLFNREVQIWFPVPLPVP